jgi:hypothetical protein
MSTPSRSVGVKRSSSISDSLQRLRSAGVAASPPGFDKAALEGPVTLSEDHSMCEYRVRVLTLELERCLRRVESAEAEVAATRASAERDVLHMQEDFDIRWTDAEEARSRAEQELQDALVGLSAAM